MGGNTDLKGGGVASSQAAVDAGANRMQTGTLTVADITNSSSYDAKGVSLSGGYSGGGGDANQGHDRAANQTQSTVDKGADWSWQSQGSGSKSAAAGYAGKDGSSTSITDSGISGGTLVITDEAGQLAQTGQSVDDVLAKIERDVLTSDGSNGLVMGWDGQKLQEQVSAGAQITATFGQQASKAVGDYASKQALVLRAEGNPEEAAKWDEGGEYRVAAHAAIGLIGGGFEGALGSGAAAKAAPLLAELTSDLPAGLREAVGAAIAAGLGAAMGGAAGASTAFNEDTNNRMLHPDEVKWIRENAGVFAKTQGISEKEAYDILLVEAAAYVDKGVQDKLAQLGEGYDNQAAIDFLAANNEVYGGVESFNNSNRNDAVMFSNELGGSSKEFVDVFNALAGSAGEKSDWHLALAPSNAVFAHESASQWGVFSLQLGSALIGAGGASGAVFYPVLPSLAKAGVAGAGGGGVYTFTTGARAFYEWRMKGGDFTESFADEFSWSRLVVAAGVGAVGGIYTRQMLTWAGLPIGFIPSFKTVGGAVIRSNQMVQGAAISKAANAAVDHYADGEQKGGRDD